jgi:hypothetical protein
MASFTAGVQYNDWVGTAAADNADQNDLSDYLRGKGLITADEFLFAVEFYVGENHAGTLAKPHVVALVFEASGFDSTAATLASIKGPIPLRRVEIDLSANEFLLLFKRLSLHLT